MRVVELILLVVTIASAASLLVLVVLRETNRASKVRVEAPLNTINNSSLKQPTFPLVPSFTPSPTRSNSPSPIPSISISPSPLPSSSPRPTFPQPTNPPYLRPPMEWPSFNATSPSEKPPRLFDRFIVIVLENMDYSRVITDPYVKELMTVGVSFSNFSAMRHPSYPNYLAMVGGETFGVTSDKQITIHDRSIADLLEAKNLTWKSYAEDYPGNCFLKKKFGKLYRRKHVPFLSFRNIQKNPKRCANIVQADQFYIDAKSNQLPNYAFISPNMENDGHNTNLPYASGFLQQFLTPILSNSAIMNGTLIEITYDESKSKKDKKNKIFTILIGPMVKKGLVIDTHYNHYNILREVERNFELGTLGKNDENASLIIEDWIIPDSSSVIFR
jgi:hypothetical protein